MKLALFYSRFSAFLLFFCVTFVTFFFFAIDGEYNMNQMIDRGFISRNAIFFEINDPSRMSVPEPVTFTNAGELIDYGQQAQEPQTSYGNAPENILSDNNLTRVESLLSAGNNNYYAAVHTGTGRYVYYKGDSILPPLRSGRFFTEEECLTRDKLAVIGADWSDSTYTSEGNTYIDLLDQTYLVIGVTGLSTPSTLDRLFFINLGSVPLVAQMDGRFYIDANHDLSSTYDAIQDKSLELFAQPLHKLIVPTTLTEIVSGGIFLKGYLKIILLTLLLFLYLSILFHTLGSEKRRVSIMKVVGISLPRVFAISYRSLLLSAFAGILCATFLGTVLIVQEYFALTTESSFTLLLLCSLFGVLLFAIWAGVFIITDRLMNLREVTQSL